MDLGIKYKIGDLTENEWMVHKIDIEITKTELKEIKSYLTLGRNYN